MTTGWWLLICFAAFMGGAKLGAIGEASVWRRKADKQDGVRTRMASGGALYWVVPDKEYRADRRAQMSHWD